MCGICGDVNFAARPTPRACAAAARAIAHRGPDAEGFFVDGPVALGHRRLSILDLDSGDQPMTRDGRHARLQRRGVRLRRAPGRAARRRDIPSPPAATPRWCCAPTWNGARPFPSTCTACSPWPSGTRARRKLLLARDRLGKKPLYYFRAADAPRCVVRIRAEGAARARRCPARARSRGARPVPRLRVRAGSRLASSAGVRKLARRRTWRCSTTRGLRLRRYWELPAPGQARVAPDEAAAELAPAASTPPWRSGWSPTCRWASSSPAASTPRAVAALAARHQQPLQTFSIGFVEESFDESPWAAARGAALGTEHLARASPARTASSCCPRLAAQLDEPFADPSFLPTFLLSRFTRRHVKVALAGDGGDELFAGYDPFLAHRPAALSRARAVAAAERRAARWCTCCRRRPRT